MIPPCSVSDDEAAFIIHESPVNVVPTWNSYSNPATASGKVIVIPAARFKVKIEPDCSGLTVYVAAVIFTIFLLNAESSPTFPLFAFNTSLLFVHYLLI